MALANVKSFLRIDDTIEDTLLGVLINAATSHAEKFIDQAIVSRQYISFFDRFPGNLSPVDDPEYSAEIDAIVNSSGKLNLPFGNILAIDSFKTYDEDDNAFLFSASEYSIDAIEGRLALKSGSVWPATILRPVNGIEITFTAGYTSESDIPEDIRTAIKLIIAKLYEHRGDDKEGDVEFSMPYTAIVLLQPYKRYKVGC